MEKLVRPVNGTRFIGISNFSPKQLDELLSIATIKPKVHQLEAHPYLPQQEYVDANLKRGLAITAYTPLGNTNTFYPEEYRNKTIEILKNPVVTDIAKARACTPAQTVLAWNMQRKVVVIPKAAQIAHQKENYAAINCKLQDADVARISNLQVPLRLNKNPCEAMKFECFNGLSGM
jgi:alcohol dehydrogenase (NADP+)